MPSSLLSSRAVTRSIFSIALAVVATASFALPVRPPKTYDLIDVLWKVNLDFDHSAFTGDVTNTIRARKFGLETADFDCGPMDISSVTVDGQPATYTHANEILSVALPAASPAHEYKVRILYAAHPTAGVYFIPGKRAYPAHTPVAYTQGEMEDTRYWMPTYDFPDNKASSESYITVPKGYKAVSNGALVDTKGTDTTVTYHWKQALPVSTYLFSFVAGPYDIGKDAWRHMPVEYWTPTGLLDQGKAAFGRTDKIIDFYSKIIGFDYPWAKFAQSAVPDYMFGGMENVSAVTQTITALHPFSAQPIENSTGLVAHELAHQWFGDTVTCADWSHAWLNEGFATFMPPFWVRKTEGEEAFELERASIYQQGLGAHRFQKRPVVSSDYELPIDNFGGFIYAGGASRLYMLMDKLGEKPFWNAVKNYLNEYKYKPVTTDDFFASMSKSTGVDLKSFEKDWLYTAAVPNVTATLDGTKVVLTQTEPYFDVSPWVWAFQSGSRGGKWIKQQAHLTGASTSVDFGTSAGDLSATTVLVDPEARMMMNLNSKLVRPKDQLVAVFKVAPVVARQRLLSNLSDQPQPVLLDLIRHERNMTIKQRLIGLLGADSKPALLAMMKDRDARIREAALQAVANVDATGTDSAVLAAMTDAMEHDSNDDVRNTAFGRVLNRTKDETLAERGWTTDSFRDSWRTTALNYWAANNPVKAKKMALLALDAPMNEPVRVTAIRILGGLGDAKGETVVYDHLVGVVQEGSFGATQAALNALVRLGNPAAIAVIEPLTHSSLHFTRRAALGALQQLKAKAGSATPMD